MVVVSSEIVTTQAAVIRTVGRLSSSCQKGKEHYW